jgi:nucleotide-binding universal stress UspA family protein
MSMLDRIVIAVDGSEQATYAARRGLAVAEGVDATVDVLHVVPQTSLRLTETAAEQSRLRDRGEAALADIAALASEYDCSHSTTVSEGNPVVEISAYAAEQDADLIVLGRQGLTGLGKRLLGGVTEQVLHRSDVPVFVVPYTDAVDAVDEVDEMDQVDEVAAGGETATDYGRILIPTDGSANAEAATDYGATIAQSYGSAVHVLHMIDVQAAGGPFDAGGLTEQFIERLETSGQEAVERVEREIADSAPALDLSTAVERTNSSEGVAVGVRDYVETNDIDLIIMGSHGRSNLRRQLLGSVASSVLRLVDVPLLIVKRDV